jgi:RimJ/RimL family protein N-acetyltransferase
MTILKTKRLILRPWKDTDLEPFAKLNADPRVMEYFPATLSREESDQLAHRLRAKTEEQGWGLWAVAVPGIVDFIGYVGLKHLDKSNFPAHFTPAVEIGWRIAFDYWGKGYATEGARAALTYGFETLNLPEIVSFTAVQNKRSRRVMEKIGMHYNPKDDFDHPKSPEEHPLKRQVLYRLTQSEWRSQKHVAFRFAHAKSSQRDLLDGWFEQKHIQKWMHGTGLQNTLNGLEKFFRGESTTIYWIGYDKDIPFAFLITSPEGDDAITLDVFICDIHYLGKGLAVPMIKEFLTSQFPHVKKVLIDPEATNTIAIHVYQKVGFKIIGEFIANWHPVPHYQMELHMQDLLNSTRNHGF